MMYGVQVHIRVSGPRESLADHVDRVTEQLVALESATPNYGTPRLGWRSAPAP